MIQEIELTITCAVSVSFGMILFLVSVFYFQFIAIPDEAEKLPQSLYERISEDSGLEQYDIRIIPKETNSGLSGFAYGVFGKKFIFIEENIHTEFDPKEKMAVIYHEVGHHLRRDILKTSAWFGIIATGFAFIWLIGFFAVLGQSLVGKYIKIFGSLFLALGFVYLEIAIMATLYSREKECRADEIAANKMGTVEPVKGFISKMNGDGEQPKYLSDLPIYRRYVEAYPTNQERLDNLDDYSPNR